MALVILGSCKQEKMPKVKPATAQYENRLISVENNISLEDWSLTAKDLGLDGEWSVKMKELKGGKQEDVQLIEIDNGILQLSVIPTRGMSIFSVTMGDITLGWDSPVKEKVHPKFINFEENGGLGWLDGFNEWMTRCGMAFAGHPGMDNGSLLTLHGKIGNIPASEVQVIIDEKPPHRIRIRGRVDEVRFNGPNFKLWTELSTEPGSNSFRIDDVLTNNSLKDEEFMVLYHANFGPPLLEQDSRLYGTIEKVVPFDAFAASDVANWSTYTAPELNIAERVNCIYPSTDTEGKIHFVLSNANQDKAVGFNYPVEQLPYFTQWKNMDSKGYVTGLEPGTGFPHNRSVERKYGRVPVLAAGASRSFNLEYTIYSDNEEVEAAIEKIGGSINKEVEVTTKVIEK